MSALLIGVWWLCWPVSAATLNNVLPIPGEAQDQYMGADGMLQNRLGGFGSDLYYHQTSDTYYGLADSGPARGFAPRVSRIQQFKLDVDRDSGTISQFRLLSTIPLTTADGAEHFDGLHPLLLGGQVSSLGLSLDPEGLVVSPDGHFFVADEYGPSLYEFEPVFAADGLQARFVRSLAVPENLRPVDTTGAVNYLAERESDPALVHGRQDNRGFEGLAISPDGRTLLAALQAPLADEGARDQGRRGRGVRLVQFDTASGLSTGQYVYQLEDLTSINDRVTFDFEDKDQGRDIGLSSIRSVNDHQFLVIERDNRGIGPENPIGMEPVAADVGVKRIYEIDISEATDVSRISLAGMNSLPPAVNPVSKSLVLDLAETLRLAGLSTPEKTEGLAIGPRLNNGQYVLLVASDNDSSVLSLGAGELLDVYTDGSVGPVEGDAAGRLLLPSYLLSFSVDLSDYVPPDGGRRALLAGDADQDYDFDQLDLVMVQQSATYLTGRGATWGQGDWNGAPGGSAGNPPAGDRMFDQWDIVAALSADIYLTGPYAASAARGEFSRFPLVTPPAGSEPLLGIHDLGPTGDFGPLGSLSQPPGTSVPEPPTVWPLACGLVLLLMGSFLAPQHHRYRSRQTSQPRGRERM